MNCNYNNLRFVNRSQATKQTNISYIGNKVISQKFIHSLSADNVLTYSIYLQPGIIKDKGNKFNFCPYSTKECRMLCLCNSGLVKVEDYSGKNKIRSARLKRSLLFLQNKEFYFNWIIADIKYFQQYAKNKGYYFAVRLNGTSDIDYINLKVKDNKNIFELFPNIQFYDYTANINLYDNKPDNYHLTFSYKGTKKNIEYCKEVLKRGENIAVVFSTKKNEKLPETFLGYKVINGDLSDYRPIDKKNCIVGLRYKLSANKELNNSIYNSNFVINVNSLNN